MRKQWYNSRKHKENSRFITAKLSQKIVEYTIYDGKNYYSIYN